MRCTTAERGLCSTCTFQHTFFLLDFFSLIFHILLCGDAVIHLLFRSLSALFIYFISLYCWTFELIMMFLFIVLEWWQRLQTLLRKIPTHRDNTAKTSTMQMMMTTSDERRATTSLVCYMDVFHRFNDSQHVFLSLRRFVRHAQAHKAHSHLPQNNVFGLCRRNDEYYTLCADYAKIFVLSFYLFPFKCDHSVFSGQFIRLNVSSMLCDVVVRWCVRNKFAAFRYFSMFRPFSSFHRFRFFHYQQNATTVIDIYSHK